MIVITVCTINRLHLRHMMPSTAHPRLATNRNHMFKGYIFMLVVTAPAIRMAVTTHSNQNCQGCLKKLITS